MQEAKTLQRKTRVDATQTSKRAILGMPSIAKWLTAPVKAVNVITNKLVPTVVFIII